MSLTTDLCPAFINTDPRRPRPPSPRLRPPPMLRDLGRSRSSSNSSTSRSDSNEGAMEYGRFASLFSGHSTASSASSVSDGDCVSPPVGTEFKKLVEDSLDRLPRSRSRPKGPVRLPANATSPTSSASCTDLLHPYLSLTVRKSRALSISQAFLTRKSMKPPSLTLFERRRVMRRSERAFSLSLSVSPSSAIAGYATSPTTPTIDMSTFHLRSSTWSHHGSPPPPSDKGLVGLWPHANPHACVSSATLPHFASTVVYSPDNIGRARLVYASQAVQSDPTTPELDRPPTPARPVVCPMQSPLLVPSPILQLPSPVMK
ncbi:unnamed protein product [Peniophora sp. CBMAI 1063]|nr:unnamed protein product [Peniophora sp. CBMAI 1063]